MARSAIAWLSGDFAMLITIFLVVVNYFAITVLLLRFRIPV